MRKNYERELKHFKFGGEKKKLQGIIAAVDEHGL